MGEVQTKNMTLAFIKFSWKLDQYWSRVCERLQVPFSLRFRPRSNVRLNSFDRSVLRRTVQSPDRPRPQVWFGFIFLLKLPFSLILYNLFHYYNLSKNVVVVCHVIMQWVIIWVIQLISKRKWLKTWLKSRSESKLSHSNSDRHQKPHLQKKIWERLCGQLWPL